MVRATAGLQSLADMAQLLTRVHVLDDLIETAAEHACAALRAATVSIGSFDPELQLTREMINVGDLAHDEERWPSDECYLVDEDPRLTAVLVNQRTSVEAVTDAFGDDREKRLLERLGKGSSLLTPIVIDGRTWGEFYATRHVGAPVFDADAVAYAEVLVAILAAAVSRALREEALAALADRDPLTGLLNRRALDERATTLFKPMDGQPRPVGIVAVDIDGLKRVNDTHGHTRGDALICRVAVALTEAFSALPSSLVARVGGDEFTIVAAGDDVARLRSTIDEVCRRLHSDKDGIGLSAGLATTTVAPGGTVTVTALFAEADRAQYVAKRAQARSVVVAAELSA